MRVVLDTNVLLAAFLSPHGASARAVKLWTSGDFDLVTSAWQIEEFRRTSRYDRIRERVSPTEIGTFVNALRENAVFLEQLPRVDLSPDPDDNHILTAAIAGEAHYLVTGDKSDLQALGKVQGVRILNVREFVELMG